jgi:hypothetical protein
MKLNNILTEEQILMLENMNSNIVLLLEAELQQSDDEPHPDDEQASQGGNQADSSQQDPNAQSDGSQSQQNIDPNTGQPIPTPEEQFAYELEGAEDKFIQMVLYERLMELSTKLELLQISVQDGVGVSAKYFYDKISQYKQYVEILNELIFSISTSTIYKLVGQIELELIDLLNEYTLAYHDNLVYDEAREANK